MIARLSERRFLFIAAKAAERRAASLPLGSPEWLAARRVWRAAERARIEANR